MDVIIEYVDFEQLCSETIRRQLMINSDHVCNFQVAQ